jgi:prefoldin subunit 5
MSRARDERRHQTILARAIERLDTRINALTNARDYLDRLLQKSLRTTERVDKSDRPRH